MWRDVIISRDAPSNDRSRIGCAHTRNKEHGNYVYVGNAAMASATRSQFDNFGITYPPDVREHVDQLSAICNVA